LRDKGRKGKGYEKKEETEKAKKERKRNGKEAK